MADQESRLMKKDSLSNYVSKEICALRHDELVSEIHQSHKHIEKDVQEIKDTFAINVKSLTDQFDNINKILTGTLVNPGLLHKIINHDEWINEKKKSNFQYFIGLLQLVQGLAVAWIVYILKIQ